MGPGVPALGVRRDVTVTAAQVAATIAALVGEDVRAAVPAAAPAITLTDPAPTGALEPHAPLRERAERVVLPGR